MNNKVLFALSGGVDSTLGAQLLIEAGYNVTGVYIQFTESNSSEKAIKAADELHIPLVILDLKEIFKSDIIRKYCESYQTGQTPNPCIECNQKLKFGYLNQYRLEKNYDYLATGHYAITDQNLIYKGHDLKKDQSYFLYRLDKKIISDLLFPLGKLTKEEVRKLASEKGFSSSQTKDSLDICFLNDQYYLALNQNCRGIVYGDVLDINGKVIGKHPGISHFTIGQRHGFETKISEKLYVKEINAYNNTITVSEHDALYTNHIMISNTNFLIMPQSEQTIEIKIRYQAPPVKGHINLQNDMAEIITDQPVWAPTPGQSAVIYNENILMGGGIIQNA